MATVEASGWRNKDTGDITVQVVIRGMGEQEGIEAAMKVREKLMSMSDDLLPGGQITINHLSDKVKQ